MKGSLIGGLSLLAFILGINSTIARTFRKELLAGSNIREIAAMVDPYIGRTMAFAVLSLSQLFHSFNMRSEHSLAKIGLFTNVKLLLSFFICSFLQIVVISVRPLANIFKVVPLNAAQWSIVLVFAFMPIVIVELQKRQ